MILSNPEIIHSSENTATKIKEKLQRPPLRQGEIKLYGGYLINEAIKVLPSSRRVRVISFTTSGESVG